MTVVRDGAAAGELSFYDMKSRTKLSTVDAHMTVHYDWSPDGRYFLTAILFPRLRVDNGFRLWSCAGGLVHEERIDEMTLAAWRPQPLALFPPPTDADLTAHPAAPAPKPTSKATKYVPPGQRAAGGGGRSLSQLAGETPSTGRSLSDLAAVQERGGTNAIFGGGGPIGAETTGVITPGPHATRRANACLHGGDIRTDGRGGRKHPPPCVAAI